MDLVEKAKRYIEDLEILRDNLSYDYEENYNKILEIANNFDNDFEDIYLIDIFYDSDFITKDDAEHRITRDIVEYGLDSVRCFINDTTADTIYKLDGYGNLENVCISDFENVIDNMIDEIKNNLEVIKIYYKK